MQGANSVRPSIRHSKVASGSAEAKVNVAAPDCVGTTGAGAAGSTRTVREAVPTLPAASIAAISKPCTPSMKSYGFQPDSQPIVERSRPGRYGCTRTAPAGPRT